MEEKIIITSELYNVNKVRRIFFIIGIVLAVAVSVIGILDVIGQTVQYRQELSRYEAGERRTAPTSPPIGDFLIIPFVILFYFAPFIIVGQVIYLWLSKYELTVTNKRVYGKIRFGRRVDLPFDMVSAVGTSFFKGIAVNTASGAIAFRMIKNRDDIYNELNKLLIDRQDKSNATTTQIVSQSNAEELKKYKDLFDSGILTQEEFEAKKKQLLGL